MASGTDIQVRLRLTGQKEFASAIKSISDSTEKLGKSFNKFSESVKNSAKNITLLAAAATAAAASIVSVSKANAQFNSDVNDLAAVTGLSTDALQGLVFATRKVGNDSEETLKGVQRFADALGELQRTGGGALESSFKDTDAAFLSVLKNTKSTEEALDLYIKRVAAAKSPQEQLALASDIFGRKLAGNFTELTQNFQGLDKWTESARAAGAVLDKDLISNSDALIGTLTVLRGSVFDISRRFTALLEPAIGGVAKILNDFIVQNGQAFIDRFVPAIEKATVVILDLVKLFLAGGPFEGANATALKIFNTFGKIKDAIALAFNTGKNIIVTFLKAIDPLAKLFGASGVQVGIALVALKFTGLLGVLTSFFGVGLSALNLFVTVLGALPGLLLGVGSLFTFLLTPLGLFTAAIIGGIALFTNLFTGLDLSTALTGKNLKGFFEQIRFFLETAIIKFRVFVDTVKIYLQDIPGFIRDILLPAVTQLLARLPGLIIQAFAALTPVVIKFFSDAAARLSGFLQQTIPLLIQLIRTVLQALPGILSALIQGALTLIRGLVAAVGPILLDLLKKTFDALPALLQRAISAGLAIVTQLFNTVGPQLLNFVTTTLNKLSTLIGPAVTKAIELIKVIVLTAGPPLLELAKKAFEALPSILAALTRLAIEAIKALVTQAGPALLKLLVDVFKSLPSIIVAAVKEGLKLALNAALAIGDTIKNAVLGRNDAPRQLGGPPPIKRAGGGLITGPGTATSDSIPALLSNREFVVRAAAVKKYGVGMLNALNSGALKVKGFAEGGLVSSLESLAMAPFAPAMPEFAAQAAPAAGGRPINLVLPDGRSFGMSAPEDVARQLQKALRNSDLAKSSKLPGFYK